MSKQHKLIFLLIGVVIAAGAVYLLVLKKQKQLQEIAQKKLVVDGLESNSVNDLFKIPVDYRSKEEVQDAVNRMFFNQEENKTNSLFIAKHAQ